MEAIEFVKSIREQVVDSDYSYYQTTLKNTDPNVATDPTWKEALILFNALTEDQKVSFLKFSRMVQVNAVSHIFGILDGSSYLDTNNETFVLKTESNDEPINGDLQDLFLEIEEN